MPDLMFGMMGVATLIAETLFFLVLFFVVARRVLPVMMMLMHLGIWVFQGLRFFDLVALQLIFYDPTPAIERARQRLTQRAEQGDAVAGRAPAGAWRTRWAYPIGGCAIIVVMLGVWSRQIEFYPLSSMNLYASFNGTSEVKHMRILAHYDGGRQERVYLQHLVDLLDRTNYRQSIARGFMPEAHPDCQLARRYVRACLEAHNRRNPTQLIHALEIQEWRWDYRKQPAGGFGDVARRYVVPMTEVAAAGSGK
jgi:hypothetical protein